MDWNQTLLLQVEHLTGAPFSSIIMIIGTTLLAWLKLIVRRFLHSFLYFLLVYGNQDGSCPLGRPFLGLKYGWSHHLIGHFSAGCLCVQLVCFLFQVPRWFFQVCRVFPTSTSIRPNLVDMLLNVFSFDLGHSDCHSDWLILIVYSGIHT